MSLERIGFGRYRITNANGDAIEVGEGGGVLSAVELLLAALASCAAADIEYITNKRAQPESFTAQARGDKIRDEHGNHLTNMELTFSITFPENSAGKTAQDVLPRAVEQSRDRLCTVSRTLALPNDLTFLVN